jgi:hypothetical protein
LKMQKRYGKFIRKILHAPVTNGALYRAKAGKYLALNANVDINTRKGGHYYPAVLELVVETIEVKLPFQLHLTKSKLYFNEGSAHILLVLAETIF